MSAKPVRAARFDESSLMDGFEGHKLLHQAIQQYGSFTERSRRAMLQEKPPDAGPTGGGNGRACMIETPVPICTICTRK
eukprot:s2163_g10.t1